MGPAQPTPCLTKAGAVFEETSPEERWPGAGSTIKQPRPLAPQAQTRAAGLVLGFVVWVGVGEREKRRTKTTCLTTSSNTCTSITSSKRRPLRTCSKMTYPCTSSHHHPRAPRWQPSSRRAPRGPQAEDAPPPPATTVGASVTRGGAAAASRQLRCLAAAASRQLRCLSAAALPRQLPLGSLGSCAASAAHVGVGRRRREATSSRHVPPSEAGGHVSTTASCQREAGPGGHVSPACCQREARLVSFLPARCRGRDATCL